MRFPACLDPVLDSPERYWALRRQRDHPTLDHARQRTFYVQLSDEQQFEEWRTRQNGYLTVVDTEANSTHEIPPISLTRLMTNDLKPVRPKSSKQEELVSRAVIAKALPPCDPIQAVRFIDASLDQPTELTSGRAGLQFFQVLVVRDKGIVFGGVVIVEIKVCRVPLTGRGHVRFSSLSLESERQKIDPPANLAKRHRAGNLGVRANR